MVDWGRQKNPFLEAVQAISITGEGQQQTPEERELEAMRGPKVADRVEDDPRLNGTEKQEGRQGVVSKDGISYPAWLVHGDDVADQNRAGSYEALMGGWSDGWGKQSFSTEAAEQ